MTVKTDVIHSLNPADESLLEEIPVTSSKRVKEIIGKARVAQSRWAERSLEDRSQIIRTVADNIKQRFDEFAKTITKEQGKPLPEAKSEIQSAIKRVEYFCQKASRILQDDISNVNDDVTGIIKQKPLGVIAAIKPWNFPINLPSWTLIPALLAGNTIVFKPSELTPITGRKLIECFPEELSRDNIINLVQGGGEVGRTIVENEFVDGVSFIGSRQTGKWIYKASSSHLRNISLELGGKDPVLILEEADLDIAVEDIIHGAFKNCGQVCCGIERCLVHEKHFKQVYDNLRERIENLQVGNGFNEDTDIGPMIREQEQKRVSKQLQDARDAGAQISYPTDIPDTDDGFWQSPAIVTEIDQNMRIMNEETFGPVVTLEKFENVEEALEKANRLEYGLGASVYSEDTVEAKQVAERLQAGSIGINQTVGSIVELPWGGVKKSGVGRLLGGEGFREFTESVVERWNTNEFEELNNN